MPTVVQVPTAFGGRRSRFSGKIRAIEQSTTASAPPADPLFTRRLLWILFLNAAVTLPYAGLTTIENVDEGRIAEISREMAGSGDWIVPRIGGIAYASYPPLQNWLIALSGLALGFNEFAMRLPTVLAGLALVWVVGRCVRRIAGDRAGLVAALVLASLQGFVVQENFARADVLVTLFATIAFDRFLVIAGGDHRFRQVALLHVAIALGILAKGPLAVVILACGIAGWLAIHRRWTVLRDLQPQFGIPIVLGIAGPWYLLAGGMAGAQFLEINLLLENVDAFARGHDHPRPFYMHLVWASSRLHPWLVFLPLAIPMRKARGLSTSLAWLGAVMLFLTLSASKRPNYQTFFHPAFAMATGIAIADALWRRPGLLRGALHGFALLVGLGGVALLLPLPWEGDALKFTHVMPYGAAAILAVAVTLSLLTQRKGAEAGLLALAAIAFLSWTMYHGVIDPRNDDEGRRTVAFCRSVRDSVPANDRVYTIGPDPVEGLIHFYVGHPILTRPAGPGWYLLGESQLARFEALGFKAEKVREFKDHRNRYTFLIRGSR